VGELVSNVHSSAEAKSVAEQITFQAQVPQRGGDWLGNYWDHWTLNTILALDMGAPYRVNPLVAGRLSAHVGVANSPGGMEKL